MGGGDDAEDKAGDSIEMVLVSEWLRCGDSVGMATILR